MKISIVEFKKIKNSLSYRFDAEYFHPTALLYEDRINKLNSKTIEDYGCQVVSGPFGSSLKSEAYLDSGIPFIRISDLRDFIIDNSELIYISKEDHRRLSSSRLSIGDLVLSKVGNTIGIVSIIIEEIGESNISENNIGIRFPKNILNEEKRFILVFLNSTPGQSQILRCISGNAQPKLNVSDVNNIKIPHFQSHTLRIISELLLKSTFFIEYSKKNYQQAEQILLSELGLLSSKPKHRSSYIKKFSDTQSSGRIDAEYFQPMYEEIVKKIRDYKKGYKPLGEIVKTKDRNFIPKDEAVYRYIELANISANGNINGCIEASGKELPTRARRKVNTGDVIVSSIEGSLSSIALISDDLDGALCSTGFFVVNSDKINSETLLVLFKSPVGQLQLKKGCSGTILTAIGSDEFKKITLPEIPAAIQREIKHNIKKMYEAKALSKHLLDIARQGVELAIEKTEKTAQEWINIETKKLGIKI
ncbi:MAG: hypothetical protein KKD11_03305 [Candidatus Omnitrophica bacterium]|nr:hypothetical protein [Candidatus Omnitrophota bacterium]